MSLKDDLHPGSYKGYSFLIASSNVTGGRKNVVHSYPNSDKQTVEDLGLIPRVFQVAAIVNANAQNNNYLQRRNGLLAVLEEGGEGTLFHPLYGQVENVVVRTWTLIEDLTELGDGKISITFTVSNDLGVPVKSQNTLSSIDKSNDDLLEAINVDTASNFKVDTSNLNSFNDSKTTLEEIADSFSENTSFLQASADEINAFSRELVAFQNDIVALVQSPQRLADGIQTLFNAVGNLYPTAAATADVLAGFFGFNDEKITRQETTKSRIERNNNDNILRAAMQNTALSLAYLSTAQIEFSTVSDIEERADLLEIQYQKVVSSGGFTEETKAVLKEMRDNMQGFFDDQKLTARQLITINSNVTSSRLLAFQYYGDSTDGEVIGKLNNTIDVTFLEDDLIILTA